MIRAFLAVLAAAAVAAAAAQATTTDPRLDTVASKIAGHPVQALCYERGETGDPFEWFGAWGYVWMGDTATLNLAAEVCDGALGILNHDPAVPYWKQALGALVVTHESFHQRLNMGDRGDEAATECRAVRHFRFTVQFLGGTPELATDLQAYALAMHYRLAWTFPQYGLRGCKVPWWWS